MLLLLEILVVLPLFSAGQANDDVVDSFSQVDMNEAEERPVRFGLRYYDVEVERYNKISKSLGSSLNTGLWPTLWEVSSTGPAPWYAEDDAMDWWVGTVYRNLFEKHVSMQNATRYFGNHSIDIIGTFLGVPEAYVLSAAQKKYREEKAAKEEDREPNLLSFDVTHNGLDHARIDDLAKFFAASVDHLKSLGVPLPFVELFNSIGVPNEDTLYVKPSQVTYLVKKTREQLDARNLLPDEVKIMVPGVDETRQLKPYLKALAKDKEAYDKLYAISTYIIDKADMPLEAMEKEAIDLMNQVEEIFPSDWEKKPIVISGLRYEGNNDVTYQGMRYHGDVLNCYEDKHQRKGHKTLKDSICQSPAFAVRALAGVTMLLSNGFPWVVYTQAADMWWDRSCHGLIDKNDKPKQLLAAFETVIPYFTNETYPIKKQWKNYDECFISAFKSVQQNARYIVTVTNNSPDVCERSFSLKGIDLWDTKKSRVVTYNNGTVDLDATRPYKALISTKTLNYDIYDEENEFSVGPEIEFDLTVGPHASATAIIDSKVPKRKKKTSKPKKKAPEKKAEEEEEYEIEFDEDEDLEVSDGGINEIGQKSDNQKQNITEEDMKLEHSEL